MHKYICKSLEELPGIVKQILPEIAENKTVCFSAAMGAGKTTMIKQICIALGVESGVIQSPTYGLVNEYRGNGIIIYHFDLYRLKDITEAYDFGIEEYFEKDAICLLEWPEVILPIIPRPYLEIKIEQENEDRVFITEIQ